MGVMVADMIYSAMTSFPNGRSISVSQMKIKVMLGQAKSQIITDSHI